MLSPVNFLNSIAIITCCIECRWHTNLSVTFSQRNEPTNNSNENMMQYVAKKLFVCFSFWIAIYSHSNVCTHICWFRARKTFPDTKHFNFSIVPFCSHTHTHILRERFAAAATAVSVLSILFVCSIFGWGGAGRWRSLDALLSFSSVNRHRCFCERAPKTFFAYFYGTRLQRAAYMFAIVRTHQPIFTHSRISFSSFVCFFPLYFT